MQWTPYCHIPLYSHHHSQPRTYHDSRVDGCFVEGEIKQLEVDAVEGEAVLLEESVREDGHAEDHARGGRSSQPDMHGSLRVTGLTPT